MTGSQDEMVLQAPARAIMVSLAPRLVGYCCEMVLFGKQIFPPST